VKAGGSKRLQQTGKLGLVLSLARTPLSIFKIRLQYICEVILCEMRKSLVSGIEINGET